MLLMPTKVNKEERQNFIQGRFYDDIGKRQEYNEDGEKISQWVITLS
jgi:hypothetical protein